MSHKKYDFKKIEKEWQEKWQEEKTYEPSFAKASEDKPDLEKAKNPFYNLMMFPYPSAEGLHVGNMYAFVGSDIHGRFKRMQGHNVFEPIGLDGFGIHSENYALKIGAHPADQAKKSEKRFYEQLRMIGNGFAWDEKLETYDPEYYRWTQWIFIQMFERGLAYRKKAMVNWCPNCKTVLADEQVISGECERCEGEVIKKELEQWFFKITDYAERLLKDLDKIDWSERVKIAQRNWIGRSNGAEISFQLVVDAQKNADKTQKIAEKFQRKSASSQRDSAVVKAFTTRPDTLFGATYMVLSPEHKLLENHELGIRNYGEIKKYIEKAKKKTDEERITEGDTKTGIELKGIKVINPATKEEIPVWVADYVLGGVGTGAIMAVPAHDERDFEFATCYNLPVREVITPQKDAEVHLASSQTGGASAEKRRSEGAYEGEGKLVNSGKFNGMGSEEAKWEIVKFVGGKKQTNYRLRDWLISRQRYWGPPIPMIHCKKCDWQPVPEEELPVKLPHIKNFRPIGKEGESPLSSVKSFYETKCPKCDGKARRETDVSDTFLDSAWYYYRYIDTKNKKEPFGKSRAKRWLPVDMYIGGSEHSVLHLLYTRFITKVFHDWKLIDFDEPFKKFRAHGLLIKEGAKMSKSKGNVVNPDKYIEKFGTDVLRMYLMFIAPFEDGGDFRDEGIMGPDRFLKRAYKFFETNKDRFLRNLELSPRSEIKSPENLKTKRQLAKSIKKVTEDIENLHYNTAIPTLMTLLYYFEADDRTHILHAEEFLKLLAPFAPHITEEIWRNVLGHKTSIHLEEWPEHDPKLVEEKKFDLVIQINGKTRSTVAIDKGISKNEAEELALGLEKVKKHLVDKKIKKIIFVKDRLINFVVDRE